MTYPFSHPPSPVQCNFCLLYSWLWIHKGPFSYERSTKCCCGELYRICPALLSSKYLSINVGSMQDTLWVEETPLCANTFQENTGFGSKWHEGFLLEGCDCSDLQPMCRVYNEGLVNATSLGTEACLRCMQVHGTWVHHPWVIKEKECGLGLPSGSAYHMLLELPGI